MRGLANGIAAAAQYSKRTVPQIVNTSAYWVAVNAKNGMPFVAPERVDSELAVIATPVIGKRGKPLKRKRTFRGGISEGQRRKDVPLAALIVAARANPKSNYNQITNQRYRLPGGNPFKGVSRAEGAARMRELEDRMIKSRHRSGKFLLAGWIPAIRTLAGLAVTKFLRGAGKPSEGAKSFYGGELGSAQPARENELEASATIANEVGAEGMNAGNFNRALMLYGIGPLQMAIDQEGERQMAYALKKYEAELAERVNKHWG